MYRAMAVWMLFLCGGAEAWEWRRFDCNEAGLTDLAWKRLVGQDSNLDRELRQIGVESGSLTTSGSVPTGEYVVHESQGYLSYIPIVTASKGFVKMDNCLVFVPYSDEGRVIGGNRLVVMDKRWNSSERAYHRGIKVVYSLTPVTIRRGNEVEEEVFESEVLALKSRAGLGLQGVSYCRGPGACRFMGIPKYDCSQENPMQKSTQNPVEKTENPTPPVKQQSNPELKEQGPRRHSAPPSPRYEWSVPPFE